LATLTVEAQVSPSWFDDRTVQDIRLDLNPADWRTLRDNYLSDAYYPAKLTWEGQTVDRIGIRSRGAGSRSPDKPNLKLDFNQYVKGRTFLGLQQAVLKANNQDPSLLREVLAMKLFRQMGLPAPLEAPARLYINGEFWGAYSLVEAVDEAFLRRNFGEDAGYLYSWQENRAEGYRFEYLGPDPASYSPVMWTPENHKSDPDPAPIVAMVQAINLSPDADFECAVSQFLDLKSVMTYAAIEDYLATHDSLFGTIFGMNNFYFYRLAGGQLAQFLPWDQDSAIDWERRPLFTGLPENVLGRRAIQVPGLRQAYLEAMAKAATVAGGPGGWLEQELNRLYYLIRDSALQDPHKQCSPGGVIGPCGAGDFETDVEHLRQFARDRVLFVVSEVIAAGYQPSDATPSILGAGAADAGSDQVSPLFPGSVIGIWGERLAADTAPAQPSSEPTFLAGVIVAVNGERAPILYVSPGQIKARLPLGLAPGPAALAVFVNGVIGNTVTVEISSAPQ
jgi:hypothetical protein